MDKMLVDSFGDVTITSDGRTILDEMDIQHPAAKMMVEVAKTQDNEAGDGTTTAVIISGELLNKARRTHREKRSPHNNNRRLQRRLQKKHWKSWRKSPSQLI